MLKRRGFISWTLILCLAFTMLFTFDVSYHVFAADESLLANGSFENDADSNGVPDGWWYGIYGGTPIGELDTVEHYKGTKSVKITGSSLNDRSSYATEIDVTDKNGFEYYFSIWCKTNNINSSNLGTCVRILFLNSNNEHVKSPLFVKGFKGTNDWTKLETALTIPYGTKKIRVEAFLYFASGTVWWDKVELLSTNMILNSGFEADSNSDGVPDNWGNGTYTGTPQITLDTGIFYGGLKSEKIVGTSSGDRASISQSFNVSQLNGSTYKFSVYHKTENIVSSDYGTVVRLTFKDSGGAFLSNKLISGAKGTTDGWKKISDNIIIPEGAATLSLELFLWNATGTVWWDEVQLQGYTSGLINESSFENDPDSDGLPYAWVAYHGGNPIYTMDNNEKKNGAKSFKITGDTQDDVCTIEQNFPIQYEWGKCFKVSAWVKTDNIVSGTYGSCLRLTFKDSGGNSLNTIYIYGPKGTSEWTKIEDVVIIPEAAVSINVQACLWYAAGTVWWDMVDVIPVGLVNGSFETDEDNNGYPDSWGMSIGSGTPIVTLDSQTHYQGGKSVKMTGSSINDMAKVTQTFVLPPDKLNWCYKISIYHKVQDVSLESNLGPSLRVTFKNNAGEITYATLIYGNKGTQDWEKIERCFSIPTGSTKIELEAILYNTGGTIWWDQAEIVPVLSLSNRDFEIDADSNNIPDGWEYNVENGNPQIAIDTNEYYSISKSTKSVRMIGTTLNDKAVLTQTFDLSGQFNQGGSFSVYYRTADIISDSYGIHSVLTFLDSGNNQVGNSLYLYGAKGTNKWGALSKAFIPPDGAVKLRVQLYLWQATGTIWWDSCEVVTTPVSQPGLVYTTGYGKVIQEGQPTFYWYGESNNISKYTLQYSRDRSFTDGSTVTVTDIIANGYKVPAPLAEGTWYTRLKGTDVSNNTTSFGSISQLFIQRLNASPDMITPNSDNANDSSMLSYIVQDESTTVTLAIYDSNNNVVRSLVNSQIQATGLKQVEWDGKNDSGQLLPDGNYTAKLSINAGQTFESVKTVAINAADIYGYRGLENNKDWTGFYDNILDNVSSDIINYIDPITGYYTRLGGPWQVASNAGYAYLLASAYLSPNCSLYGNVTARDNAIKAFDWCVNFEKGDTGSWARERRYDPNIDRFALNPLAEAYILLKDYVDAAKRTEWLDFLLRAAYYQKGYYPLEINGFGGSYPNMDAAYVLNLGLVGTIANDQVLKDEAHRMLLLMEDDISDNGGFYYIIGTNPSPNYQNIVIALLGRYYEITGDSSVPGIIEQTVNYFPLTTELNSASEHLTCPELKRGGVIPGSPIGPDIVAYFTGDSENKMVSNIDKEQYSRMYLQTYYGTLHDVYTLIAARGLSASIKPEKLSFEGTIKDPDINGFREKNDGFSAAITSTKRITTLATALVTNNGDALIPVNGLLGNVSFESKKGTDLYFLVPPGEVTIGDNNYQAGVIIQSVFTGKIGAQYMKYIPTKMSNWRYASGSEGDWCVKQSWVAFKNRLIGMNTMEALTSSSGNYARSRLIFGPPSYATNSSEISNDNLFGNYNSLGFWLSKEADSEWEYKQDLIGTDQYGTTYGWESSKQIAVQKKETSPGIVDWDTGDKMSFHAVFFPLDGYATAKDWYNDQNSNNIRFVDPQSDVHATQIDADDGSNEVYAVITNHTGTVKTSNMTVILPDGNYSLSRYEDDTGIPVSTENITVSGGSYELAYNLEADMIVVYKIVPR